MDLTALLLQTTLAGPPGCHRMQIDAHLHERIPLVGRDDEHHTVQATLSEGVWSDFSWKTDRDTYHRPFVRHAPDLPIPAPAIGRLAGAEPDGLERLLGALAGDLLMLHPSPGGLTAVHTLDSQRGSPVLELTAQADPGADRASTLDAQIDGVVTGDWGRMRDLRWSVQLDEAGLPLEETFSAVLGRGAFRMRTDHTLRYTRLGPCDATPAPLPAP